MKAFPDFPGKKLASEQKIDDGGADGKNDGDQTFQEQAGARDSRRREKPRGAAGFFGVNGAQKGPHGESCGEGQHYVWNQDAREEKQADASANA